MRTLTIAFVLASISVSPLAAQQKGPANPNPREGFWIGLGLGAGSAGADCPSCSTQTFTGLSGYFKLGGTVSRNVLIGAETNGLVHSESGTDESMGFLSGVLVWYPSRTGAFFLKVGIGALRYTATGGGNTLDATAASGSFGLGYDFRVRPNFSITPFLNSLATSGASFTLNGSPAPSNETIKLNLVQFGVGVTWH
jgi:hypothetical protein